MLSALLLVATGNDQNLSSNNDPVNSCEVIDMANSTTSCSNLPIYPQTLKQATGQVLDSTPIIIGGHSSSGYHDQVYKFDYLSNSWQYLLWSGSLKLFLSVPQKYLLKIFEQAFIRTLFMSTIASP